MSILLTVPALAQPGYRINYPQRRNTPPPPSNVRSYDRGIYHNRPYGMGNTYYGLRVGLALSTVNSDDAYLDGSGMASGITMGLVTGFQLAPSTPIFFETGLSYTEKGGRGNYAGSKFTYDLNYLELPLLLKYDYWASRDMRIQPFIGGYLACGVGGKVKDFGHRQAVSSFNEDFFRRFDGGLRIGCGVEFTHLYGELAYDLGLSNICHDTFSTSRNGCLLLSCGVNF